MSQNNPENASEIYQAIMRLNETMAYLNDLFMDEDEIKRWQYVLQKNRPITKEEL
jgi:hypothetical protein